MLGLNNFLGVLTAAVFLGACQSAVFPTAKLGFGDNHADTISGQLFKPNGKGPFAAVVLLHSCGGVSQRFTHDWPNYLTGLGYAVLTVDSLGPRNVTSCKDLRPRYLRNWYVAKDAYGALDYLSRLPNIDGNRVAVIGFSSGANAINLVMYPTEIRKEGGRQFRAAIAFYGRCSQIGGFKKDYVPLMQIVPELDVQRADTCIALKGTGIDVQVLKGAHHAFDNPYISAKYDSNGNWMTYDAKAAEKARKITKSFLAKFIGR